ncbi:MAG: 4Fe-4S dicluster domain-containing protein [Pseudomonadota bacterium]|nr:4Fe-4S dicluster domain-containing protein [Pseudomonadota bacterium]
MNRRDFLRNAAVASSATAAACVYDPKVPAEHVLPYVHQDDDMLPGVAQYFATTCTACASACGMLARVKEGRVVFVEGNPDNPSGVGLCTRGHMVLTEAYNPDRFATPLNAGKPTTWDEALAAVQQAITQARADGKTVAWLGQYRTGSLRRLLDELAAGIGLRRVHWDALGIETLLAASRAAFNKDVVPTYDLSDARTIVSFGMDFLSTSVDSMHMIHGWSQARDPQRGGFISRFVAIEPRVGTTAAQADNFLPPTPGTEAMVAMALARLVHDKVQYVGPGSALVASVDVAAAAQASGISQEKLEQVAGWITEAPSVVLPGGHANASVDGTALAIATFLINEFAGNVGRSMVFGRELQPGPVNSYTDVKALLEDARAGRVGVLFVDGVNPVYNLPLGDNVAEALDAVGTLVHFTSGPNDSLRPAAIVLPASSGLEDWGDTEFIAGVHSILQPAMNPLLDTRGIGDVLLALGRALAPADANPADATPAAVVPAAETAPASIVPSRMGFAHADFGTYVKARWEREIFPLSGGNDFKAFWVETLQRGGYFVDTPKARADLVLTSAPAIAGLTPGADPVLVVFPHAHLADGRNANQPWAQELPDPLTTFSWTTWAEISPGTAKKLGLGEKDKVKIKTASGELEVGYFASPGVPDNVVAINLGNGHEQMGRYGTGRGANPIRLLASASDPVSGALAYYSVRASVARTPGESDIHAAIGNLTQDGRPIANTVTVEDAVANVDGKAGSIVHLHQIPVDERLTSAGITDMYPEPQHPTYRFGMAIDTNVCTGCMACVVACNLENNIPFVGPDQTRKGRVMSWIRMDRFWEGEGEHQDVRHMPSLCQHCAHAPCEGVCPVLATYHNLDGLNAMIYNRCVGTRYCANNCPYTARRFNFHSWEWPESMHLMLNPDVSTREMGVMEKCSFCVQRIRGAKDLWRDVGETVPDQALQKLTACASACPSDAITFGNAKDAESTVAKKWGNPRAYTLLGELNTKPGIRYLARARFSDGAVSDAGGHGGGQHGAAPGKHDAPPHEAPAHAPAHKEG